MHFQTILDDFKVSRAEREEIERIHMLLTRIERDPTAASAARLMPKNVRQYGSMAQTFYVLKILADAGLKPYSQIWPVWKPHWVEALKHFQQRVGQSRRSEGGRDHGGRDHNGRDHGPRGDRTDRGDQAEGSASRSSASGRSRSSSSRRSRGSRRRRAPSSSATSASTASSSGSTPVSGGSSSDSSGSGST
jgi:hypothetical protein